MTNRQIVSNVKSALRMNSADISISDRAILSRALNTRNKYIKQAADKRKLWESPNIFTPLKVRFKEVPLADFEEYHSDCNVARSIYKLPKIVDSSFFGLLTQGAFSIDIKKRFIEVSPERFANMRELGIPGNIVYYWMFNGYLWASLPTLETLILPSVLLGARVPKEFRLEQEDDECSNCPTNPMDEDFRCPGYMIEDIENSVTQYLMSTYKRSIEDTNSNDKDESR